MTNNEAAKWIQLYIDLAKIDPTTGEAAYLNDDDRKTIEAMEMAINALTAQPSSSCVHENDQDLQPTCNNLATDCISRQAAIEALAGMIDRFERLLADIRESKVDDSVCGMCEYDGAYMGQSGDWCNECPGFEMDDCFKLSDKTRKKWTDEIIKALPSAQPERKEGEWEIYVISMLDGEGCKCSECGFEGAPYWDYCPNCGSYMRGERNE